MTFERIFTRDSIKVNWITKEAVIFDGNGNKIFSQEMEAPDFWSDSARAIVASKYFKKINGVQETSVKQLIKRVVDTIVKWGIDGGYFNPEKYATTEYPADVFADELTWILTHQYACFNSPIWFNFGVPGREQQAAACFLLGIEDNSESIRNWSATESKIFKGGSGSGINISPLRPKGASLSSGGYSSGPMSFAKGADANAGVWKSGGVTRRAAKLVRMDATHPDIEDFITCKAKEELKAQALIAAGWDGGIDGEAYSTVAFQNMNHSVGVTDDFMNSITEFDAPEAKRILKLMAQCAWESGDPGIQYDTTINSWNTIPNSGRITTSNPCQSAEAPLLTPQGIRRLGDVNVGDLIWSGTRWTKISNKVETGIKPVYRYVTRAGIFIGTEEHRIVSNGEKIKVSDAESIDRSVGDKNWYFKDHVEYDPQQIMDGLVLGDGQNDPKNHGKNNYIVLHIGEKDHDYFSSEVSNLIGNQFDGTAYLVTTSLKSEDIPKTYLRSIPLKFIEGNALTICSFLRGLYSANGSVLKTSGRIVLKAASRLVIEQVQMMLSSIGIPSYYTVNKPHMVQFSNGEYECKESYDLNITNGRHRFADLIGFIQKYKQDLLKESCLQPTRNWEKQPFDIVDIEYLGDKEVYDITVEAPEHTYWTGGLLVSNCGEYLSTDWSSCLLASFNLLQFKEGKQFNYSKFSNVVHIFTTALDIIISNADYPDDRFKETAHKQRQIGLGYANLGALIMSMGLPYGSDAGRQLAKSITSRMTAEAYIQSATIAEELGPFADFAKNRDAMLSIIKKQRDLANDENVDNQSRWHMALDMGIASGYRNSNVSLLAPTGTIAFMMGCDTTGIESDIALVKYKKLVGGGTMQLVNQTVPEALDTLGYDVEEITVILECIASTGTIENCPALKPEHLPVFDCSFKPANGTRFIHYTDHLKMVAAVQPYLSMGISKTINMPNSATVENVYNVFIDGWKLGIKSISLYRDGSKQSQPLNVSNAVAKQEPVEWLSIRRTLPAERPSITHKCEIGGLEVYLHVGLFDDGTPGELFIDASKAGSTVAGLLDALGVSISYNLQYGVPLEMLVTKFSCTRFEPAGFTSNPHIRLATSVTDYIFRWLESKFLDKREESNHVVYSAIIKANAQANAELSNLQTGETCKACGAMLVRTGTCLSCRNCGVAGGCG